jgi:hypothetical protein
MIDQRLIDNNTVHAQQSIVSRQPTSSSSLWLIRNIFDTCILEKLKCYIDATADTDWAWRGGGGNPLRKSIMWEADSVIEELHTVCGNLTKLVQKELCTPDIEFMAIQLWKDSAGFNMSWHVDKPVIHVALQIYLLDSPENYGTTFDTGTEVLTVPHVHNTGYMAFNNIRHRITSPVIEGTIRYSFYAIWKLKEGNETC